MRRVSMPRVPLSRSRYDGRRCSRPSVRQVGCPRKWGASTPQHRMWCQRGAGIVSRLSGRRESDRDASKSCTAHSDGETVAETNANAYSETRQRPSEDMCGRGLAAVRSSRCCVEVVNCAPTTVVGPRFWLLIMPGWGRETVGVPPVPCAPYGNQLRDLGVRPCVHPG